jgi:hypothetical protein
VRIRQIKPAWWLDKTLRRGLTADQREFYIGLWMLADDAGYLEWDPVRIAAELYPYETVGRRESRVTAWAFTLEALEPDDPHLLRLPCGHAVVPKMPGHQRISGKQTVSVKLDHQRCPAPVSGSERNSATDSQSPPGRVGNGRGTVGVGNGTVGNGIAPLPRRVAESDDVSSEFQAKVPRPGVAS